MKMRREVILGLVALGLLSGCVERQPELSPADRERLREFVGTEAPSPEHEDVVQFENGVRYLGYDVDGESITPGQPITITWYWHAAEDLDDGWQMFTHVADAEGESRLNQDHVGVVREIYQPGRWQAGQYIKDVQEVTLPEDWNSDRATFYLGLWNGPHRLAIQSGNNDGENRIRALSIDVSAPAARAPDPRADMPAAPPPPSLRASRLEGELNIDGELDEEAWTSTPATRDFVNTLDNNPSDLGARARMLWDDDKLYVGFHVEDDFLRNDLEGRDAHLWEQDAVEIMVDPDGDGRNYFEIQVSPTGEIFDTRYDARRQPGPFGHLDWNADIEAAVSTEGTPNDDDTDEGYTVEIAIPWSAFATGEPPASRPEQNAAWRINLYVMDARAGDDPIRSAGWSATMTNDFHVPPRFGRVLFGGAMAAAEAVGPQAAEGDDTPRAVPLPPGAAAALRDTIQAGQRIRDPRAPAALQNPEEAAQLQEAMRQRRERQQQAAQQGEEEEVAQ